jgi:hypothetical protein
MSVCCNVQVSSSGRSLVQRSANECGVSVITKPQQRGGFGTLGLSNHKKNNLAFIGVYLCTQLTF